MISWKQLWIPMKRTLWNKKRKPFNFLSNSEREILTTNIRILRDSNADAVVSNLTFLTMRSGNVRARDPDFIFINKFHFQINYSSVFFLKFAIMLSKKSVYISNKPKPANAIIALFINNSSIFTPIILRLNKQVLCHRIIYDTKINLFKRFLHSWENFSIALIEFPVRYF